MRLNRNRYIPQIHAPVGPSRWLTTFNDMVTLLMVFFVLLFSMGSMDIQRFQNFQNALQSALGVLHEGRHAPVGRITQPDAGIDPVVGQERARDGDSDEIYGLEETPGLEAEVTPRGIQLILDDNLLFASGKAILTPKGLALLDRVIRIIGPMPRHVRVEGHTDDVPIGNRRFRSNWELSTARAVQVVKYLDRSGRIAPRRLSAAGYGDSRPRVPNVDAANRSKNRRVEIILGRIVASPVSGTEKSE